MSKFMINYPTFVELYREAREYKTLEMYIRERGWQSAWMDTPSDIDDIERAASIIWILETIYDLSNNYDSIAKLRKKLELNTKVQMANDYSISYRTLEKWERGEREMLDYTFLLISYTVFVDLWIKDEGNKNDIEEQN